MESPAPRSERIVPVAVVIGGLLLCATAVLLSQRSSEPPAEPAALARPSAEPAASALRRSIKNLALGMSLAEVRQALPEMAHARSDGSPHRTVFQSGNQSDPDVELPGQRWTLRTTILNKPSTCTLDFTTDDQLSQLCCQTDAFPAPEDLQLVTQGLVDELTKRYGKPQLAPTSTEKLFLTADHPYSWEDDQAKLMVIANNFLTTRFQLALLHLSREHERLADRLYAELRRRLAAEKREKQRVREEVRRLQLEKLRRDGNDL